MKKVLICLLALCAVAAAQEKVVGGHYVVNVTGRSATVGWIVQAGEAKAGVDPQKPTTTSPVLVSGNVGFPGLPAGQTILPVRLIRK